MEQKLREIIKTPRKASVSRAQVTAAVKAVMAMRPPGVDPSVPINRPRKVKTAATK